MFEDSGKKQVIDFLIKLFGTFAFLIFVVILGKELKSSEALNQTISFDSVYLDSAEMVDKENLNTEQIIHRENEKRDYEYNQ